MTGKARTLKAEGKDVISFAAGEPDFNTPEPICDAAIKAIQAGMTKYTPSSGTPQLKQAVIEKLARENGIEAKPEQIVVSCGAKHSLYNSVMALINPGDEVLLFAPYWMTYADQVRLAGGIPVVVHADASTGFVPSIEQVEAKITPKTRAMMINSPSNPTGAAFGREQLSALADLAAKHDLWVISDEIYERLTYGHAHVSFATLNAQAAQKTITISGCSKSYAMTGWRIGFACAPARVAKAMSNLQDQVTSNPTSFAQAGAIAALNLPAEAVEAMRAEFETRRDLILGRMRAIDGLNVHTPQGAFYVFPDVSAFLGGQIATDIDLANYLLDEALIASVPGSVFEGPGHLRFSYAASQHDIERGMDRLAKALAKLKA